MAGSHAPDPFDPTVYPVEEKVGEDMIQRWVAELLRPLLERFLNQPGVESPSFVGADQFIYYLQYDPHRRFAPDVYVLPNRSPTKRVTTWKVWEHGRAPTFALEVVSKDWLKDYCDAPERCDEAGIEELVIFDPNWDARPRGEGARWQVYRRTKDERFERVVRTDEDRVYCETLGAFLRAVGFGDLLRLRVALPPDGEVLFPTEAEAHRAEAEAHRAEAETHREEKERLREENEAARARIAALEAELRKKD